jgi:hypothetical protein
MVPRNLIRQKLERHEPMKAHILGLVNNAHAPTAQFFHDAVMRYGLVDHGLCRDSEAALSYEPRIGQSTKLR